VQPKAFLLALIIKIMQGSSRFIATFSKTFINGRGGKEIIRQGEARFRLRCRDTSPVGWKTYSNSSRVIAIWLAD
jgi:hypothetical protein